MSTHVQGRSTESSRPLLSIKYINLSLLNVIIEIYIVLYA